MQILQNISGNSQQRHLCIWFCGRATLTPVPFGVPITSSLFSYGNVQLCPELSLNAPIFKTGMMC